MSPCYHLMDHYALVEVLDRGAGEPEEFGGWGRTYETAQRKRMFDVTEEMKANYVDHISIAVKDLKKAEEDFIKVFGWKAAGRYKDVDENIKVVYFQVGPTAVEIMEDMDGTGEVAKFIEKRGEGIMVLSFNVDNCRDSMEILKRNGARLIDEKPRLAKELNRYFAFIHPKACHGVLTEVIEGKY